jgi:hypothetical protein
MRGKAIGYRYQESRNRNSTRSMDKNTNTKLRSRQGITTRTRTGIRTGQQTEDAHLGKGLPTRIDMDSNGEGQRHSKDKDRHMDGISWAPNAPLGDNGYLRLETGTEAYRNGNIKKLPHI